MIVYKPHNILALKRKVIPFKPGSVTCPACKRVVDLSEMKRFANGFICSQCLEDVEKKLGGKND